LKEVAGTTVYDEKRAESLVKMEENNTSINKITEILVDIETRLAQLQSEKEELVVYQQHDRQRRSLEYTLYEKELCKARTVLDQIENERCTHVETVADLHAAAKQTHDDIQNLTAKMNTKSNILRRNRTTIRQLEDDARNAVTKTTRLELGVAELQERLQSLREQATLNQASLHVLEREIASKQTELDETVLPAYNQAVAELNQMTVKRDDVAAQIEVSLLIVEFVLLQFDFVIGTNRFSLSGPLRQTGTWQTIYKRGGSRRLFTR
jgi:structural maintenance of chromosome 3 (chondroitin sulfate proteoglycan 6)